jgi:hypothetical protein
MVRAAEAGAEAGAAGPFSVLEDSCVALGAESAPLPLFDFPPILDDRVVRVVGVLVGGTNRRPAAGMLGCLLECEHGVPFLRALAVYVGRSA